MNYVSPIRGTSPDLAPHTNALVNTAGFANAGFATRTTLPTGFIPTAIVEGDFNEDGHMDVAISNGGDNSIYVLLGNGD